MKNQYKFWTKKEELEIIEFMKTQGLQILADRFGVTYQAISDKIFNMKKKGMLTGIKRRNGSQNQAQ